MYKILGIVGSPRKNGNTDILIDNALLGVSYNDNFTTEKVYLSDLNFKGCTGCEGCAKTNKCVVKDDMQIVYEKIDSVDAIIFGSPTYFYNVSSLAKMFMDRLYAYEVFDPSDRSVWLSVNEVVGIKYAATIAVCEQQNEYDMGFTSEAMSMTLSAVGFRCVENLKVLHLFKKGEASKNELAILNAQKAGDKLAKTVILAHSTKRSYNN